MRRIELLRTLRGFIVRAMKAAEVGEIPDPQTIMHEPVFADGICRYRHWNLDYVCDRPVLTGYDYCFWHVNDMKKYDTAVIKAYFEKEIGLKEAIEAEVAAGHSLAGAFLARSTLGGNLFQKGANLTNADLRHANLSHAHLSYASLNGARLVSANLESAYLSDTDLRNCDLRQAHLCNAKLRNNDFTTVHGLSQDSFQGWPLKFMPLCRIFEGQPDQSREVYKSLVRYFTERGDLDSASWAAYKASVSRHRVLRKNFSWNKIIADIALDDYLDALSPMSIRLVALSRFSRTFIQLLASYVSRFVFGYGEKPVRVCMMGIFVVLFYAMAFTQLHALSESGFKSALYFSLVTFTTLGYGDISPKPEFRLFAVSEAIVGVLIVGLLLFTFARRAIGRG